MSSFGVVVCLSLFLPCAIPAPTLNSTSHSVLKFGGTETKNEEVRRLKTEKSMEHSKELDDIFKKLVFYINAHFNDTSRTSDLKCETIKGDKENFVFYKVKGKLFPKRKPIYVTATQPVVGTKKYFEISTKKKKSSLISSNLKFNESRSIPHHSVNITKVEYRPVIDSHNREAEPSNTDQLEEALLFTDKIFLKNGIDKDNNKEIATTDITKSSHHQNINVNHFGEYEDLLHNDITKKPPKNTNIEFKIAFDPKTHADESLQMSVASEPSFDSHSYGPSTQIYKYVTKTANAQYSSLNNNADWDSTHASDESIEESSSSTTTLNVYSSSLTNDGKETLKLSTFTPTTEQNELNFTTSNFLTPFTRFAMFTDIDESNNVTEYTINNPIEKIKPSPPLSNVGREKINQSQFIDKIGSTSPTKPLQPNTSNTTMNLMTFIDQVHKLPKHNDTTSHLKQINPTTESNLQSDYFHLSGITELSYNPSTATKPSFSSYSFDGNPKTNTSSESSNNSDLALVTDENNWDESEEQTTSFTLFSSSFSLNKTAGVLNNLNFSFETKETAVPSLENISVNDLKSEPNIDNASLVPLDTTGVSNSVIEKDISISNYSSRAINKITLGDPSVTPSTSFNSPQQTSIVIEVTSEILHKELQDSAKSNYTKSNQIQNQKSEAVTNSNYPLSPGDEKKPFHSLTSGSENIEITDNINFSTTEYSLSIPISSQKISPDKLLNEVTTPSLNNLNNHETAYPDLYTPKSLSNNTDPASLIFHNTKHSEGISNNSQLTISNFGLEFENRSSSNFHFNNSYLTVNNNISTTKHYLDEESTNNNKNSNKFYEKVTNYSTGFSTASLLYTVNNFQSMNHESETAKSIHVPKAATISLATDYSINTEKPEEFSKEKNFASSLFEKFTSGIGVDKSSILLTTTADLLTDKLDKNNDLYNSNWIKELSTSAFQKSTKTFYNSTSTITDSLENHSSNYFLQPHLSSSVIQAGSNSTTPDNSQETDAFNYTLNGNVTTINVKVIAPYDDALLHSTYSTYYSNRGDLSVTQPLSTPFYNTNIKGVTITSGSLNDSYNPERLYEKTSQPPFDYEIKNKTENFIKAETKEHNDYDDSLIEDSTASIIQTIEYEKVKKTIDPLSIAEKLITNNPSNSAITTTNQHSQIAHIISSIDNVSPTTPLSISNKGDLDSSISNIVTTEPITVYSVIRNMGSGAIVKGTNETGKTLTTFSDRVVSVSDKMEVLPGEKNENIPYTNYLTTLFGSALNTDTQRISQESNSSILTTNKPYNLTIQEKYDERSSGITTTEIHYYGSSENTFPVDITKQDTANLNAYSKESHSINNQDDSNTDLTNSTTVKSTKNVNFPFSEKHGAIVNITENPNAKSSEKYEDIFKTTPKPVITMVISKIDEGKNDKSSIKKTTTYNEITSLEKHNENSSTNKNKVEFEMSTQKYQTMPSFNNFTFLLPTTDYLTSYLPVRIQPFIAFGEIK